MRRVVVTGMGIDPSFGAVLESLVEGRFASDRVRPMGVAEVKE